MAAFGETINRYQHICLREVTREAPARNLIGNDAEIVCASFGSVVVTHDVHCITVGKLVCGDVIRIHQHHAPTVTNAAVAVVKTIDRGVELIVRPDGGHDELARTNRQLWNVVDSEFRLAIRSAELTLVADCMWQFKAIRLANPRIHLFKARNNPCDTCANSIIISHISAPIDTERSAGHGRHNRGLAQQVLGCGRKRPC